MRWEWDLSSLAPMRLHSITAVFIWLRYGMVDGKSGHNSSTPCIHAPCNVNLQLLSPRDRIYTYNLLNLCQLYSLLQLTECGRSNVVAVLNLGLTTLLLSLGTQAQGSLWDGETHGLATVIQLRAR